MQPNKSIHPRARLGSFTHAFRGLRSLVRQEPNAKLHAAATLIVVVLGFVRHIGRAQWLALVGAIALVWIAEALNTCVEMLCDLWCGGGFHPQVKIIKDIAAAAVVVAAIAAFITGILVFIP